MSGAAEVAQIVAGGGHAERILLATRVVDQTTYDQLVTQAASNAAAGNQIISVLNQSEHGGMYFRAMDIKPGQNRDDLPAVVGKFGTAYALGGERGDREGQASIVALTERTAIIEAVAVSGLAARLRRRTPHLVRLNVWGFPDEPVTIAERHITAP